MFGLGGRGAGGGRGERSPAPGPAVNVNERRWQTIRNTIKKSTCNYFEYHRRGLSRDPTAPWDDPNNLPLFREPPPGVWDGRYEVDVPKTLALQAKTRRGYERFSGAEGPEERRKRIKAEAGAEVVRTALAKQGLTVQLNKILGFGGNGVASLFEVWPDGANCPSKKVVVKSLLHRDGDVTDERYYNMALKRARHIIQLRSWGREILPAGGMGEDELKALENKWAPIDKYTPATILTLEFMRNGDLHGLIKKLTKTNYAVPQPVLWRIFFCLVRGCIAMYSPPRSLTRERGRVVPAKEWQDLLGPDLDEVLPEPPRGSNRPPRGWNFIHFDLDPQNVLIGETDVLGEHTVVPIFKISDLGLGRTFDDPILRRPYEIWAARRMGKTSYLLPEQHHKEWDYIRTIPPLENPKVAGRYGEWSNLFQVGLCMHSLITKAMPPYPPTAIGPINSREGVNLFSSPTIVCDSKGNPVPPFYTHGFNLAAEPGIDEDFMLLLLRCLADLPQDRPPLAELQWLMRRMEASPRWAVPEGDPDGVQAWCDRLFGGPNPPLASAEQASLSLSTASWARPADVFATAVSRQGAGNDRVPPTRRSGGDGGQGGDDDSNDFGDVPLGGESFMIPDSYGAWAASWDVL